MMSVLAVIPARLGATRLARKPLRLVGGLPLVVRVWQQVTAVGHCDRVVVATDADEVRDACRAHDIPVVMTRPDHPSGTDRVAEVLQHAAMAADVVVNVQGDEPFVTGEAIEGALAPIRRGLAEIGTVAVSADDDVLEDPGVVKVVCDDAGRALLFSRAPIPFLRDGADRAHRQGLVRRHVGIYAYTPAALARWVALPPHPLELVERLEQLRPLAHGMPIGVTMLTTTFPPGVDTEADLVRADAAARAGEGAPVA